MAEEIFNDRERLWDLIKDIRYAMFTTRYPGGELHSRPMTTQNRGVAEDDVLWFFMPRDSEAVAGLLKVPSVNIAYASPDDDRYVSVSGQASLSDDMNRKRQLWSRAAQAWFPKGVEDPNLALVRVSIQQAEYWDMHESKFVQLVKAARAVVTGQPPEDLGEHGRVQMR
jgi:general stress protein 26